MREVWWLDDGRAGHRQQTRALLDALEQRLSIRHLRIAPLSKANALRTLVFRRSPITPAASPELIIGAGHATHLSLLALSRALSCKSVVLMRPSLPMSWFDFAIIPQHDMPRPGHHCLATIGVLCPTPSENLPTGIDTQDSGLILIGGPSRHCVWDQDRIVEQIDRIVQSDPQRQWQLSTSPRTPRSFLPALPAHDNLQAHDYGDLPADWLEQQLALAKTVWISPDSASMVYQSLSFGGACGLFELQGKPGSKVLAGLEELRQLDRVVGFGDWLAGTPLTRNQPPLREADRAADWLIARLDWGKP